MIPGVLATAQAQTHHDQPTARYDSYKLAFVPDGGSLLSNGPYGLVRRDWRTGKELQTYPYARGSVAFLNSGKTVAVVSYGKSIAVLDADAI